MTKFNSLKFFTQDGQGKLPSFSWYFVLSQPEDHLHLGCVCVCVCVTTLGKAFTRKVRLHSLYILLFSYHSHHSLPPSLRWWQFLSGRAREHYDPHRERQCKDKMTWYIPYFYLWFTEKPCDSQVKQWASSDVILMLVRRYSNCTERRSATEQENLASDSSSYWS